MLDVRKLSVNSPDWHFESLAFGFELRDATAKDRAETTIIVLVSAGQDGMTRLVVINAGVDGTMHVWLQAMVPENTSIALLQTERTLNSTLAAHTEFWRGGPLQVIGLAKYFGVAD
jgi:hypothetical protein